DFGLNRRLRTWKWQRLWSHVEELRSLQLILGGRDTVRTIVDAGAFVKPFDELNRLYTNINNTHSNEASHFLIFRSGRELDFTKYLGKLAQAETERRMVVAAIALERYHAAQARYPERLEELSPKYMEKVPIDFMDGKPLRYRLKADVDYLLYSV